ncbi:unnamed protein product [Moneuplotes crassus]|uniref:Uncharacterized protein n=1 Tax=Euplotes crassus TaxID=5936 RepID=A0AAD1Y1A5_EUPCR|nr:unnamed protein product [Moneuplotes crassus]
MEFVDELQLNINSKFENYNPLEESDSENAPPESLYDELFYLFKEYSVSKEEFKYIKEHTINDSKFYDLKTQVEMLRRDMNSTAHNIDEISTLHKNKLNTLKNEIRDAFALAMSKTDLSEFTNLRDQLRKMTPMTEFKKMYSTISMYATRDEIQTMKYKLEESLKTEDIMSQIKETKSFFEQQINKFIMKDDFSETFKMIDDSLENYRKVIHEQTKKLSKLKDDQSDIKEKLSHKLDASYIEQENKKIWDNFSNYCSFQHLADFRKEIRPKVKSCEKIVCDCIQICTENKAMIRRFDEVICEKASKFTIIKLYKDIEVFLEKEKFRDFKNVFEASCKGFNGKIIELKAELDQLHIKLSGELTDLLEDTAKIVKKSIISEIGGSPIDSKELAKLLLLKADKSLLENEMKNKADVDHINYNDNKIHLIENQFKQFLQVFIGVLKTSLAKSVYIPNNEHVNDTASYLNQVESIYSKFSNCSQKDLHKIPKIKSRMLEDLKHNSKSHLKIDRIKLPFKASQILKRGRQALSPDFSLSASGSKSLLPSPFLSRDPSKNLSKSSMYMSKILDKASLEGTLDGSQLEIRNSKAGESLGPSGVEGFKVDVMRKNVGRKRGAL